MSAFNKKFGITTAKSDTGFSCSMTGYTSAIKQLIQIVLWIVTLALNTIAYVLPGNLKKGVMYAYNFATSSGSWFGYLVAAIYYVLTYFGYGAGFC